MVLIGLQMVAILLQRASGHNRVCPCTKARAPRHLLKPPCFHRMHPGVVVVHVVWRRTHEFKEQVAQATTKPRAPCSWRRATHTLTCGRPPRIASCAASQPDPGSSDSQTAKTRRWRQCHTHIPSKPPECVCSDAIVGGPQHHWGDASSRTRPLS